MRSSGRGAPPKTAKAGPPGAELPKMLWTGGKAPLAGAGPPKEKAAALPADEKEKPPLVGAPMLAPPNLKPPSLELPESTLLTRSGYRDRSAHYTYKSPS